MEKLLNLLEEIRPDVDFRNTKDIATAGYIDSFDIVSIISALETEYQIEIPVDSMVSENFESVEAMLRMVKSLGGETDD